jgi:glycosyltransferase involved in cell wall biosynthesis
MQPEEIADFSFVDGRDCEGPGTIIFHVSAPLLPLAKWRLGRRVLDKKYIVGYWAWELPQVPLEWRHGIPFVDEIWVPSKFSAEAIMPIAAGRTLRVLPHSVMAAAGTDSRKLLPHDTFNVLTIFDAASSFARKNPLASIAAFRRAFGDDPTAHLIVKASNLPAYPQGASLLRDAMQGRSNMALIEKTMSAVEIGRLYQMSDVVMSLHRAEGFGLTIAEAMARGLPVVATDWSGNVDFLNSQNGLPVSYQLIPAVDPQGTYNCPGMVWADPDIEGAAEALRALRESPDLGRRLGEAAADFAARTLSPQGYADTVCQYLGL